MEVDTFLASPRWDILKLIIDHPSSPTEIAEEIDTTISFVSQQLKLLEAIGFVNKKRTRAVEKGKPRALYSIAKESLHITPLAKGLGDKQLISLDEEKKATLRIWNLNDKLLERFFWIIHHLLDSIKLIAYQKSKSKIYVISDESIITHLINETRKFWGGEVHFQVMASSSLSKLEKSNLSPIYDPESLLSNNNLKGGLK